MNHKRHQPAHWVAGGPSWVIEFDALVLNWKDIMISTESEMLAIVDKCVSDDEAALAVAAIDMITAIKVYDDWWYYVKYKKT